MASSQQQEVFPPELEEIIFSIAVQSDWENKTNLLLVAKRVYERLIPQIYKIVIFNSHNGPRITSKQLIHHGKHVRHIEFTSGAPLTTGLHHPPGECITWCPNVVNVGLRIAFYRYDKTLIEQILKLQLTHLTFDIGDFITFVTRTPAISSSSIVFPYVTHLELSNSNTTVNPNELKAYFPALTHLSLNGYGPSLAPVSWDVFKLYRDQIRVLIVYQGFWGSSATPAVVSKLLDHTLPADPRVVLLDYDLKDVKVEYNFWWGMTENKTKMWEIAETAVAGRLGMATL